MVLKGSVWVWNNSLKQIQLYPWHYISSVTTSLHCRIYLVSMHSYRHSVVWNPPLFPIPSLQKVVVGLKSGCRIERMGTHTLEDVM